MSRSIRSHQHASIVRVGHALVLSMGLALIQTAHAQSSRDLDTAIKTSPEGRQGARGGCSFRVAQSDQWRRADIDGDGQEDIIAPYVTESCGGGNYWGLSVGIFQRAGNGVKLIGSGHVEGTIEKIAVNGARIVVQTLGYGPDDARCCPTKKSSEAFLWSNGALRPVTPGRR